MLQWSASTSVPALLREVEGAPEEEGTLASHDIEEIKRGNLTLRKVSHRLVAAHIRQRAHMRVPEGLTQVGVALQREELRQYLYFCTSTCVSICTFVLEALQQVGVACSASSFSSISIRTFVLVKPVN